MLPCNIGSIGEKDIHILFRQCSMAALDKKSEA